MSDRDVMLFDFDEEDAELLATDIHATLEAILLFSRQLALCDCALRLRLGKTVATQMPTS